MTVKDRTQEFNTVAEAIRTKQNNTKSPRHATRQQKSQFIVSASQIGKEIFETSEKLNKLTKLAKKKSLFDDPAVEIEELTYIIKQDIHNLNRQISALKEYAKSRGSSNKQTETHSETIINFLNSKLANTTKDFKEILQVRTENLKTQQERRQRFTGSSAPSTPPAVPRSPSESVLFKNTADLPESPGPSGGEVAISMPAMSMTLQQDQYTSSRVNAVESIERTIAELQGIFQQLASLVAEQGDMIQRIDTNIDNTLVHVERGHSELLKHLYQISSNRWLAIKLFLVLIVFAVIFLVFFV
jgi:syntaxin 5